MGHGWHWPLENWWIEAGVGSTIFGGKQFFNSVSSIQIKIYSGMPGNSEEANDVIRY